MQRIAVKAVIQGNKPYPIQRKDALHKIADLNAVAPKTGKVLDDDAVDRALSYLVQKFLHGGPFKQNAAVTVVHSLVYQRNVRVGGYKVLHQFFLVGNAVAFLALVSRIGKPQVCRCIVFCNKKITPLKFTDFPHKSKSDSDLPDAILFPLSV